MKCKSVESSYSESHRGLIVLLLPKERLIPGSSIITLWPQCLTIEIFVNLLLISTLSASWIKMIIKARYEGPEQLNADEMCCVSCPGEEGAHCRQTRKLHTSAPVTPLSWRTRRGNTLPGAAQFCSGLEQFTKWAQFWKYSLVYSIV